MLVVWLDRVYERKSLPCIFCAERRIEKNKTKTLQVNYKRPSIDRGRCFQLYIIQVQKSQDIPIEYSKLFEYIPTFWLIENARKEKSICVYYIMCDVHHQSSVRFFSSNIHEVILCIEDTSTFTGESGIMLMKCKNERRWWARWCINGMFEESGKATVGLAGILFSLLSVKKKCG